MATFVPLGGDLAGNLVAGLIGNNIVDAFAVADANSQTGKLLRHLIGPAFDEFKSLADMDAVAASATAMDAVAASATAMNAVAASATAMDAVAASATARNAIRNSSTAFNIVAGSNMAIGKFVAGEAGLNPADYADMDAVAASATALKAICSSAIAANAVKSAIQSRRATIIATLNAATSLFNKTTVTFRNENVAGTTLCSANLNTNSIIIPTISPDQFLEGDTTEAYERYVYYGTDSNYLIWSCSAVDIDSTVTISSGVSMRGIYFKLSGGGSVSDPAVTCDVYTAI